MPMAIDVEAYLLKKNLYVIKNITIINARPHICVHLAYILERMPIAARTPSIAAYIRLSLLQYYNI